MTEYSKRDIAGILKRSHRNITYWTDFGLVIPDIQPSQGKGVARIYSERNLIEFGMIDIMSKDFGVNLDSIRDILKVLRDGKIQRPTLEGRFGKKRRQGIMEYEEQEFHDFYHNLEWGISKDLLAIENIFIEYKVRPERAKADLQKSTKLSYFVVGDDFNFNDIFKVKLDGKILFYPIRGYQKMLWLGRIKQAAAKKVDSTFPSELEII